MFKFRSLIFCLLFFLFLFIPALAQPSAKITVDFKEIKKISPYIFGNNAIAYDPCTYEKGKNCKNRGQYTNYGAGQWDPVLRMPNRVLLELAKKIKVSVLRFPGGCGTHHYNWKKTIGPIEKRPMYKFGIDEFMKLCQAIGAEPIITLSYFTGTCQDLADLVEYLNAPLGTNPNGGIAWAEVRAANGHPEPYRVKWFEFGNEVWHGDHRKIPAVDPREYARRYLECRRLIKNVDPKVKLGAVIKESPYGLDWWSRIVLNIVKDKVDFVIIHIYRPGYRSNKNEIPAKELFKITLASPDQIKDILENIAKELKHLTGKEVPIAITEYNGQFAQQKPVPYRHSLGNALFVADLLRVFITGDFPILCANYWQFSNSYTGLVYNPDYLRGKGKYYKRPNYYVFDLYANHFGKILLKTYVQSEGYLSRRYRKILETFKVPINYKVTDRKIKKISIPLKKVKNFDKKCIKSFQKLKDILFLNLECKTRNKSNLFRFIINNIKPYHIYSIKSEVKTKNIPGGFKIGEGGFRLNIVSVGKRWKWVASSRKVYGTIPWILIGTDFVTYPDTKKIVINGIIKNVKPFKGKLFLKNFSLEDLGPAPQYSPTLYVSAIASTNEKKDRIYLMVINKNLDEPMKTLIKINGFKFGPVVRAWILNGPSVSATNEHRREHVKIHYREKKVDLGKNYFYFTFEPHSVTALELKKY